MAMTVREAFEKGTDTFNAHDIDGFASVLADDVVYQAPGGITRGPGPRACPSVPPSIHGGSPAGPAGWGR